MGLGMMNMASNSFNGGQSPLAYTNPGTTVAGGAAVAATTTQALATKKFCTNCGNELTGKFCANCGTPAPVDEVKKCSSCGAELVEGAKFCVQCGTAIN